MVSATGSGHATFDGIVAFGDSMSDNGFDNGHGFQRYSNGKIWVEYLGEFLGITQIDIRAWGGACSSYGNYNAPATDWSGLQWQVEQYNPTTRIENTLFTIEIGINDLHDPITKITPEDVITNLQTAMNALTSKGAQHFLVWNLPENLDFPGYTDPQYELIEYYAPLLDVYKSQFATFNRMIFPALEVFGEKNPQVALHFFDFNRVISAVKSEFENTSKPWLKTHEYPKKNKWMWWDHWHFMTDTHKGIAEKALKAITNTPTFLPNQERLITKNKY